MKVGKKAIRIVAQLKDSIKLKLLLKLNSAQCMFLSPFTIKHDRGSELPLSPCHHFKLFSIDWLRTPTELNVRLKKKIDSEPVLSFKATNGLYNSIKFLQEGNKKYQRTPTLN